MVVYNADSDTVTADNFTFIKVQNPLELFNCIDLFEITIENNIFIEHLITDKKQISELVKQGAGIYKES